jgi:hypothetical protein
MRSVVFFIITATERRIPALLQTPNSHGGKVARPTVRPGIQIPLPMILLIEETHLQPMAAG